MTNDEMTADERAGINWWNSLSEEIRKFWLLDAARVSEEPSNPVSGAYVWAHYKRVRELRAQAERDAKDRQS